MKKGGNIVLILLSVIIILGAITLLALYMARPKEMILQGESVAKSYKVSSKLTARIDSINIKVGDMVRKGQFLYDLSAPEIKAKLVQAEAVLSAADSKYTLAKEGLRPQEIKTILSMWKKAESGLELAKVTYFRISKLYEEGVVTAQKLDEATANLNAMQNSVNGAKAQYLIAKEGARKEDKRAAAALVEQAWGGLSEVEAYLKEAIQYSPVNGEVSNVLAEKGELVGAGAPVVTIIDLDDIWFSFNVKEIYLPIIRKDQLINLYIPALAKIVETKVYYISARGEYATWSATRADGEFDIRTFEVRMRPTSSVNGLRPGMTALYDRDNM